jgi:hypothetical protein
MGTGTGTGVEGSEMVHGEFNNGRSNQIQQAKEQEQKARRIVMMGKCDSDLTGCQGRSAGNRSRRARNFTKIFCSASRNSSASGLITAQNWLQTHCVPPMLPRMPRAPSDASRLCPLPVHVVSM